MTEPTALTSQILIERPLPDPDGATDKNSRGRVLAIAGCASVPGAALLAGTASLRAGAGKIQLAVPRSIGTILGAAFPECGILMLDETEAGEPLATPAEPLTNALKKSDAILIGPGLMEAAGATALVKGALIAHPEGAFILDALALCDILHYADVIRRHKGHVVLTPHHGEMAKLLGIEKDAIASAPLKYARTTAQDLNCYVVLKSDTTYIASPEGDAWEHKGGVIGLATAGSGDVLAGLIAGLLARGGDPVTACLWAVFLHGQAGRMLSDSVAPVGFLAREIPGVIPGLMKQLVA